MEIYKGTCMITHLPILYGERVVAVALRPRESFPAPGRGFESATDAYVPFPIPVEGKYDDCGGVEKIVEGQATQMVREVTGKTAEVFFAEAVWLKETSEYCLVLILKEVWDGLLGICPIPDNTEQLCIARQVLLDINLMESRIELHERMRECANLRQEAWQLFAEEYPNLQSISIPEVSGGHFSKIFNAFLVRLEELGDVAQACRSLAQITGMLSRLRRGWTPQYGVGRQDTKWEDYLYLSRLTHKMLKDRKDPEYYESLIEGEKG